MEPPVVIGAGQSGISTALSLKDLGIEPVVLEQADRVASAWHGRYDRLRLNTCRTWSSLPGRRYKKGTALIPTRDDVIENLERHAGEAGLDIRFGTTVERLSRDDDEWALETSGGRVSSPQVVIATGHEKEPFTPDWPGRDSFAGELMHSAAYKNPEPFRDKDVLVVGPGCSGMEIAYDVAAAGATRVRLSVRTPPNIVLREGPGNLPGDYIAVALMHVPVRVADALTRVAARSDIGDLSEFGLPTPEEGVFSRQKRIGVAPAIVDKEVIEAIKERAIEIVAGVESLDPGGVTLADGTHIKPDVVICATGYLRGLEPLVGHLGVLDERGLPRAQGAEPAAPGLRFVGYDPRPGGLGYWARDGKKAARAIARELR